MFTTGSCCVQGLVCSPLSRGVLTAESHCRCFGVLCSLLKLVCSPASSRSMFTSGVKLSSSWSLVCSLRTVVVFIVQSVSFTVEPWTVFSPES